VQQSDPSRTASLLPPRTAEVATHMKTTVEIAEDL
jgi:hypothetical protein